MEVSPVALFGLGSEGTAFAKAVKGSYDSRFGILPGLMDGLCIDGDGFAQGLSGGKKTRILNVEGSPRLGVYSENRLAAIRGFAGSKPLLTQMLADLFSSYSDLPVLSSFTLHTVPTVVLCVPASDPVGSAIFIPFMGFLHRFLEEHLRRPVDRHLLVLQPELFQETASDPLSLARAYEFTRELEQVMARPAIVTGAVRSPPVSMTWVVGNQAESGQVLAGYEQVASCCAEFFTYLSWGRIDLQHAQGPLSGTVSGKPARYASFGLSRLVYPTENVRMASRGRAESSLLEGAYPRLFDEKEHLFNKTELFHSVRRFIGDVGLDRALEDLAFTSDGKRIEAPLELSTGRNPSVPAESFILDFKGALERTQAEAFGEAEASVAQRADALLEGFKSAVIEKCRECINSPGQGSNYATAFLKALVQKEHIPFAREELPQESLTLSDIQEDLRSEFDASFGVPKGARRRMIRLKRAMAEKNTLLHGLKTRVDQAAKASMVQEARELKGQAELLQGEIQDLSQEYEKLSSVVSQANFGVDDPSKRREVLEAAVTSGKEAIQGAKENLVALDLERDRLRKLAARKRKALLFTFSAQVTLHLVIYALCLTVGALGRFAPFVGGGISLLIPAFAWDFVFGAYRDCAKAERECVAVDGRKAEAMGALVRAGEAFLEERLRYARVGAFLGILRELRMDIELSYIPSLERAISFVKERHSQAYQDMAKVRENDTFLQKFIVGRKELETFFEQKEEQLGVEYRSFLDNYVPSEIWDDFREDRQPAWGALVERFCQRVFQGLWGTSIQELLRVGDLVPREIFRDKFRRFEKGLSVFVKLDQEAADKAGYFRFIGLGEPGADFRELLSSSDRDLSTFRSLDEACILGVIVAAGIPGFGFSSGLACYRASALYDVEGLTAHQDLFREELYPSGYITDIALDETYKTWCLARALGVPTRHVEGGDAGEDFLGELIFSSHLGIDDFRLTAEEHPEFFASVKDRVATKLRSPEALDLLRGFLSRGLSEREEAVIHGALDEVRAGTPT